MFTFRGTTSVNRLIRHHVRFSTKSTPKSIAADKKIKDAKESILLSKPDCLPLLFEAIEEDPKNPNSYILLAIENLRKSDSSLFSQNIDCFDKISQIGTKGLITENEKLFAAAAYSWNKGNYFHAGSLFESVLLSEPNDPLAIKLAQESYLNAGSGKNVLGVLLRHSLKASGQIAFGHIESGHITEGRDVAENTVNQKNGGKDLIALQALLNAQQLTGHSSEILSYLSNNEEHFEKTPAVLLLYANKGAAHIMRGNYHGAYRVIQQLIGECYKQYPETVIPNTHVTNIILLLWNVYIHINNDIVMYIVNMVVDLVVRNNTFNTSNNAMTDISLHMLLHLMHIIVYESDYYTEINVKNEKLLAEKLAAENNNSHTNNSNNSKNTVKSNNNSNSNNSNSNGRTIVEEGVSLWTSMFGTKPAKPTKKSTNISDNSSNDINIENNISNSIDNNSDSGNGVKEPVSFGKLYRARDDDVEFILTAEHYEAIKSAFLNRIQLNNNDNNSNDSSGNSSVIDNVRAAEIDEFFNQIKSKITVLGAPHNTNTTNNSNINSRNMSNNSNNSNNTTSNNNSHNNNTTSKSEYEIMVENAVRPIQQIMIAATANEYPLAAEVFNRNMESIERYCGGSATQRDLLVQSRIEILLRAGEWEMAKLLLRERTVRVPGDAQTWRKLGIVYRQLGEDKLAEHADYTAYTLGFGQGGYGGPI